MRLLAIGDIVGRPGRQVVHDKLPALVREHKIDCVIANGENIAGGSGITPNLFNKLRAYGIDLVTLGDHCFKRVEIAQTLSQSERILRPGNLSAQAAGRSHSVIETPSRHKVAVCTLLGRIFMSHLPAGDPFACVEQVLKEIGKRTPIVVVEIHAEASSEKVAMGHYLDGRASLVFGTHTHIPTADAKILPGGTGYITDIGMTGPYDSVLGRRKDHVVKAMSTNMPLPYDVATNDVRLCGVLAEIDDSTGKCTHIERIEVQGENVHPAYDGEDAKSRE